VLSRVCLVMCCTILAAQTMQTSQLRDLVEMAQKAEKEGDLPRAIQLYGDMLRLKHHWVSAEFHLSVVYDLQQRYPEAIYLLNEILQHDPAMVDAYVLRGKDYYETNQYEKAIESLNLALKLQPRNEQVHFYLGATFYQLKDYAHAANAYLEQIRIQPRESDLLFQLVQSYQALQNVALQKINEKQQASYFVLLLESEKNFARQNFIAAETQLKAAISANPQLPEAWLLLSQVNKEQGGEREANTNFIKALQREEEGPASFRGLAASKNKPPLACNPGQKLATALCMAAHSELSQSTKLVQAAAKVDPDDPRTLYWVAQIYRRLAEKTTARLAQIAPDSSGLHKLYARAFSQSGRPEKVLAEYEKAIAADDQDASTFIEYANFRFKEQEFPQAIRLFQRALLLTPYDFNVHGLLAQAYVHNSEPDLAVPYFSQVLTVSPGNEQLRIDLAECLYTLERTPEAISILETAPADPDGRVAYVLAKYYARQGEKDKALQAMKVFRQRQKEIVK
jgi:tetratricopeptide (TPR) repeat protein